MMSNFHATNCNNAGNIFFFEHIMVDMDTQNESGAWAAAGGVQLTLLCCNCAARRRPRATFVLCIHHYCVPHLARLYTPALCDQGECLMTFCLGDPRL
jgi:Na+/melibiose symporter-like transporter